MSGALRGVGAITLFVEDLALSKAFYERVFDVECTFADESSAVYDLGNTLINLLAVPAARGLVEPGTVEPAGSGFRFQLTVWVDDADAACARLEERGVALLNGPVDRVWGQRTASFADPSGHLWEVAQTLPPDAAR